MFTKDSFMSFYQGTPNEKGASDCYDAISLALQELGIYSDLILIGALATARVEVGRSFLPVAENKLIALQYEFRKDLGNTVFGEGVLYRGRGYIQLTGCANYQKYGEELGIDLINLPDLALNQAVAAKILARYFKDTGCDVACGDWVKVRELVDGGTNGLTTFLSIVEQYTNKITIMNKLDIVKIEYTDTQTVINWSRYDDNDKNNAALGAWTQPGNMTPDECLAFAKTMVEPGVQMEVSLNLAV